MPQLQTTGTAAVLRPALGSGSVGPQFFEGMLHSSFRMRGRGDHAALQCGVAILSVHVEPRQYLEHMARTYAREGGPEPGRVARAGALKPGVHCLTGLPIEIEKWRCGKWRVPGRVLPKLKACLLLQRLLVVGFFMSLALLFRFGLFRLHHRRA